jgi:hypothetical protein
VIIAALNGLGGSDDEPFDAEAAYRNWLADVFGVEAGEIIARGVLRKTGADIGSRVGLDDIMPFSRFLTDRRKLKDRLDAQTLSLAGPVVGAGINIALGAQELMNGDVIEGLSKMLPKALAGPVKATGLAIHGYQDKKGNQLPMEAGSWDVFVQALGFTPSEQAEQSEAARVVGVKSMLLAERKNDLRERLYRAIESKDEEQVQKMLEKIRAFNQANPQEPIGDLLEGLKQRAISRAIGVETGVLTGKRQFIRAREEARFANLGLRE